MKQVNNTTFRADNLGDVKPIVTIGGKAKDKFIPNLNMSFHNDEFFINLNRRDKDAKTGTVQTAELDGIDKDIFYIDENGRFKWDIEFKERPKINSWTWELKHSEGIEFFYQGELTAEEIADGCERPIEVIGSYAVYCNQANNKYKTGKLCHIYRPFCYDTKGNIIYADLKIADGKLTITIDETWLDNATYPVRLDPTIGFTGTPDSTTNTRNASYCITGLASGSLVASSSGECNKLYFYNPTLQTCSFGVAVYDNNGNPNYNLLASKIINQEWSVGWHMITLDSSINIVSGDTYHVSFLLIAASDKTVWYDTTSGNTCYRSAVTSFPTNWTDTTSRTYVPAVYLEYTESSGSSLPAIINSHRQQGAM